MKTVRVAGVMVRGLVVASALGLASGAGEAQEAVGQGPREWTPEEQAVIDAASRGPVGIEADFEAWEAGYHDDWTYWRVGSEDVRDRDRHMALVRDVVAEGNRIIGYEMEPVDVLLRGDIALLRFNAVETIEDPQGAVRVVRFSSASLFQRTPTGWKVLASNLFYPPEGEG